MRNTLLKLRADKSPGVDELSPRLLVNILEICDPLVMLFRKSMAKGEGECSGGLEKGEYCPNIQGRKQE